MRLYESAATGESNDANPETIDALHLEYRSELIRLVEQVVSVVLLQILNITLAARRQAV
jgi:hypothetical protein